MPGVRAQDSKPEGKKPDAPEDRKPDAKPSDAKPSDAKPATDEKLPDDLARILARFDKDAEPARSLERAYAKALYFHLARDLDRTLGCFHKDFAHHEPNGAVVPVPLPELREMLRKGYETTPPTKLTLEELIDFAHIRAYSKTQAHDSKDEGWHKAPHDISLVMNDDDWLVIAPVRPSALGDKASAGDTEVFYVFRREGADWKIVLAE